MTEAGTSPILVNIRRMMDCTANEVPDRDLLAKFIDQRDEKAFHALLRRHGPMVLDVCRGVLANEADAEDGFQATFLTLSCKAASIRKGEALASWLYGVAFRIARKARDKAARRRQHQARLPEPEESQHDDVSWREIQRIVHEEMSSLGERHRAPLVLCYLEGRTQDDAATILGIPKGTLKMRLEQGRALLRARLIRRGLGPVAILLASAWPKTASANLAPVADATLQTAMLTAGGRPLTGIVSANVQTLVETGLMAVFTKIHAAVAGVVLLLTIGIGVLAVSPRGPEHADVHQNDQRQGDARNAEPQYDIPIPTKDALLNALDFLVSKQNLDGSFGWEPWQDSVGLTATCGMALVGGEVGRVRPGGDPLARTLAYVTQHQRPNGLFIHPGQKRHTVMHEHALATRFVATVALHRDRKDLTPALERAVQVIEAAQNQSGGWRYLPQSKDADVAATTMQMLALTAARHVGVKVKAETLSRASRYLKSCQMADGGFAYRPEMMKGRFVYSAAALAALHEAGLLEDADRRQGLPLLVQRLPERTDYDDELLLGDGRLFAIQVCTKLPAEERAALFAKTQTSLLKGQQPNGSWLISGKASDTVERTTAFAVLTILETSRRLPADGRKPGTLKLEIKSTEEKRPPKDDKELLDGAWVVVFSGDQHSGFDKVNFAPDRLDLHYSDGTTLACKYSIDAATMPKSMEIHGAENRFRGFTPIDPYRCIYRLAGADLELAIGTTTQRPLTFAEAAKAGTLVILKRESPQQ